MNSQFRYAMIYVLITAVVLFFLNVYSSEISQTLFYQSKASMVEKAQLAASEIADLDVLNTSSAASTVTQMGSLKVTRLVITDQSGIVVYDSLEDNATVGKFALFPEVVVALDGSNTFTCHYQDGAIESRAATPIMSHGALIGCVYMMEYDTTQGALMASLQKTILMITLVLEVLVLLFSLIFSRVFSVRLRKILVSMRIIRGGDYSHKVTMGGHDELTYLAEEFNTLTARLQISEQKRRQFISDASHELKTPLASIKLLADSILQNDLDMDTIREFVGDIGDEADRLNRMSQKLLTLTKSDSQIAGDCEIVHMAPTVRRVARMLSAIASENRITIHLDLDEDCPILILEDDLYQITFNLVENGIKYNTPGGSLTVSLHRQGDDAVLEVTDTGVGIPEDALGHIFERFYRVDKARSRQSGGSGLGLAIVRGMVQRNRGEIEVTSTFGKGSTFRVTFPIFDVDEDDSFDGEEESL